VLSRSQGPGRSSRPRPPKRPGQQASRRPPRAVTRSPSPGRCDRHPAATAQQSETGPLRAARREPSSCCERPATGRTARRHHRASLFELVESGALPGNIILARPMAARPPGGADSRPDRASGPLDRAPTAPSRPARTGRAPHR
jgi:hypothetical protein